MALRPLCDANQQHVPMEFVENNSESVRVSRVTPMVYFQSVYKEL